MSSTVVEQRLRRALFILSGLIFLGTPVELWLADHKENSTQYIPFVLCGLGVFAVVLVLLAPQRATLYLLRWVMLFAIGGSLLGMYEHLSGNFAFELEIRPNAPRGDVLMEALKGANPLMAPGVLAIAALIALIATYYHPLLSARE